MISPNSRKLNLSHQGLTEVPAEIAGMKQLRILDLSYNSITHIPDFVMALPHLRTLAIGHNQLRALPYTLAASTITELIADYNNIDFILPSTLTGLRKLILSHNRINIGLVHTTLPEMIHLDIRHNPSIIFAGKGTLPAIHRFYADPAPCYALMQDGMQYYL
jgi:Leucine-rich repeat (LRR) protein|nr:MAG TPA: leucine-rich repeat protein [Caudoviricetes sp.]